MDMPIMQMGIPATGNAFPTAGAAMGAGLAGDAMDSIFAALLQNMVQGAAPDAAPALAVEMAQNVPAEQQTAQDVAVQPLMALLAASSSAVQPAVAEAVAPVVETVQPKDEKAAPKDASQQLAEQAVASMLMQQDQTVPAVPVESEQAGETQAKEAVASVTSEPRFQEIPLHMLSPELLPAAPRQAAGKGETIVLRKEDVTVLPASDKGAQQPLLSAAGETVAPPVAAAAAQVAQAAPVKAAVSGAVDAAVPVKAKAVPPGVEVAVAKHATTPAAAPAADALARFAVEQQTVPAAQPATAVQAEVAPEQVQSVRETKGQQVKAVAGEFAGEKVAGSPAEPQAATVAKTDVKGGTEDVKTSASDDKTVEAAAKPAAKQSVEVPHHVAPQHAEKVATAPVHTENLGQQLRDSVMSQVRDGLANYEGAAPSNITLRLHPEELGQLQIKVGMENGQVKVEVLSDNQTVRQILKENSDTLRDNFTRQNLNLHAFSVAGGGSESFRSHSDAHREQFNQNMRNNGYFGTSVASEAVKVAGAFRHVPAEHSLVDVRL